MRKIKVYLVSPGEGKYEQRLTNTTTKLKNVGFENVEHVRSVPDISLANSLSKTNIIIFEKEKGGTAPFMIVEDDITVEDSITDDMWNIDIPSDATAVYMGVSQWVYPFDYHTLQTGRDIRIVQKDDHKTYDERFIHIRGMTSTHAILFISRPLLQTMTWCMLTHHHTHTAHDLIFATLQRIYKVYALKQPFFYQDAQDGGQQLETRLVWIDETDQFYRRF